MLTRVTEALYEDNPENNPYEEGGEVPANCRNIRFTAAAITQLCRELGVAIHIKCGGCKIELCDKLLLCGRGSR